MAKFTDKIRIKVKAGHGGAGAVSYRREKYVEFGGPDGGDGGRGGNVYFTGSRRHTNLSYFLPEKLYAAQRGGTGAGRNKNGADGNDLIIKVPVGTEIIDSETGDVLADIIDDETMHLICEGGIGGKGNTFFKTSTNQTPRFSQPGEEGQGYEITLNLKLIADVGLVGLPNAGKSTLLAALTAAHPKIGDYPFTTLIPNLGVISIDGRQDIKIADIPGIIEGAHMGLGLGLSFLRHIERVKTIIYLIAIDSEDIHHTYKLLQDELRCYDEKLLAKPSIVVINKADVVDFDEHYIDQLSRTFPERPLFISAKSGYNLKVIIDKIKNLV
ncbi:MAG: GTPase ObgE [Spirochaetes bacterium]|nr:GTPase ObgE [Spirochaetota bacterium]